MNDTAQVRTYRPEDIDDCVAVFRTNTPKYFQTSEESAFAEFLREPRCTYLVIEQGSKIVACGGFHVKTEKREASLCWGMVRQELHGNRLGTRLLKERLQRIALLPTIDRVRMDTSQHTVKFYERFGFVVESVIKDKYAPGLDRIDMALRLSAQKK